MAHEESEGGLSSRPPRSIDDLVARLRDLRVRNGSPSFSEITRRVSEVRTARGVHPRERTPGRMTIYDVFRTGRRRIDTALVIDIVAALGADEVELAQWRERTELLQQLESPSLPAASIGLPSLTQPFLGRERETEQIISGAQPTIVTGMPGVGKTQVATHAMSKLQRAGTIKQVVTVDARGGESSGGATLRDLADAVGRSLDRKADERLTTADLIIAVAGYAAEAGAGVLIDDVMDLDSVEQFIRELKLPAVAVVRSRVEPVAGLNIVEITPWTVADTEDYLRARIGDEASDSEPQAFAGLAAATGGLPLAADLMAARIGQRPSWRLGDHLEEVNQGGGSVGGPVERSIDLSYVALDPQAQRALRLIAATASSSADLPAVGALLDADPAATGASIHALRAAHLVERESPLMVHPIIRSFASARSEQVDSPTERRQAMDRLADHLLARAWAATAALHAGAYAYSHPADQVIEPSSPDEAAEFWLTQLDVLIEVSAAIADRRPEVPIEVSRAISHHLDVDGRHRTAERVHRLALRCAEQLGEMDAVARSSLALGQILVRLGSPYGHSELLRAQQLADRINSAELSLRASNALAIVAANAGNAEEAVARFSQALATAERNGIDDMRPMLNDNIGIMMRRVGDLEGARDRHRLAQQLAAERGDEILSALALGNLSDVEIALGDFAGAAASARTAADLTAEQAGLQHAYALTNLGLALGGLGDLAGADRTTRDALRHAARIGDTTLVASVWNNLGELQQRAGELVESRASFDEALRQAESAGVAIERARALAGLGALDLLDGDRASARSRWELAALLFGDTDSPEAERVREGLQSLDEGHSSA